jgi:hypothetical protein
LTAGNLVCNGGEKACSNESTMKRNVDGGLDIDWLATRHAFELQLCG